MSIQVLCLFFKLDYLGFLVLSFISSLEMLDASVAQWIECQPVNQSVASSIPSLGHMLEL